jgi:autophagy-related protein 18
MNYITFNQDFSQIGVAGKAGFRIYTTEPFSKAYQNNEGDVGILEMLFSTTLVALVLSPRFLRIMNTKRGTTICDLTFPSRINAIRINRKRMIVVLEGAIYIYDIGNMKLLHQIDTPPNPLGMFLWFRWSHMTDTQSQLFALCLPRQITTSWHIHVR